MTATICVHGRQMTICAVCAPIAEKRNEGWHPAETSGAITNADEPGSYTIKSLEKEVERLELLLTEARIEAQKWRDNFQCFRGWPKEWMLPWEKVNNNERREDVNS